MKTPRARRRHVHPEAGVRGGVLRPWAPRPARSGLSISRRDSHSAAPRRSRRSRRARSPVFRESRNPRMPKLRSRAASVSRGAHRPGATTHSGRWFARCLIRGADARGCKSRSRSQRYRRRGTLLALPAGTRSTPKLGAIRTEDDMTDINVDQLGSAGYLVVAFPVEKANFSGEMASELIEDVEEIGESVEPGNGLRCWSRRTRWRRRRARTCTNQKVSCGQRPDPDPGARRRSRSGPPGCDERSMKMPLFRDRRDRALVVLPCRRPEPFPRPTRAGAYDG